MGVGLLLNILHSSSMCYTLDHCNCVTAYLMLPYFPLFLCIYAPNPCLQFLGVRAVRFLVRPVRLCLSTLFQMWCTSLCFCSNKVVSGIVAAALLDSGWLAWPASWVIAFLMQTRFSVDMQTQHACQSAVHCCNYIAIKNFNRIIYFVMIKVQRMHMLRHITMLAALHNTDQRLWPYRVSCFEIQRRKHHAVFRNFPRQKRKVYSWQK
jgi:hypothetical protein